MKNLRKSSDETAGLRTKIRTQNRPTTEQRC